MHTAGGGTDRTSAANECSMIEIGPGHYAVIARLLIESIGGREFFNGSVEYDCAEFRSRLTATLLIYRPAADPAAITDIVPVWWEFTTASPDGLYAANDFSFSEVKRYMIEGL